MIPSQNTRRTVKGIFSILTLSLVFTMFTGAKAQINVQANQTAAALAQTLVGSGVTILNPVLVCPNGASGKFAVTGSSNLGLDSGIILTSGQAATVGATVGANGAFSLFASTDNAAAGDAYLDSYIGGTTNDACYLEFDFRPEGDTIKFDYVFGSEEYTNYSCSDFNDVFAFFISGPGITGQKNLALIPGTNIPVTINSTTDVTINTPLQLSKCTGMGTGSPFSMYYVDNRPTATPPPATTVTYDGFTKVLTAVSPVEPCSTYHLKLIIADVFDGSLDSGVWLKAGSLSTNPPKISPVGGNGQNGDLTCIRGCRPGKFVFTRKNASPKPLVVKYLIQGTAINGTDYVTIPDSVIIGANQTQVNLNINGKVVTPKTGVRTVKLVVVTDDCLGNIKHIDSAELKLYDDLLLDIYNHDTTLCQGAGVVISAYGEPDYTFQWSPTIGVSSPTILNPLIRPDTTRTYTLTAKFPTCPDNHKSITITVEPNPIVKLPNDTTICTWDYLNIHAGVKPTWFTNYSYLWQPAGNLNVNNQPDVTYYGDKPGQLITTVTTPVGCTGSDTMNVSLYPIDFLTGSKEQASVCPGDSIVLKVTGGVKYLWTPPTEISSTTDSVVKVAPAASMTYTVMGTDVHGCKDTIGIDIQIGNAAVLYLGENVYLHPGERYQMMAQGNCSKFEWFPHVGLSATNTFNPVINPSVNTRYYVKGTTNDGCTTTDTIDIYIVETELGLPNAFTPLGTNHELKIVKRGIATLKYFRIFNRWGEKVFETSDIEKGWDGRLNGTDQPMGVYMYIIEAETIEGKPFYKQGNVTLIR